MGDLSQTKVGDKNIFSIERNGVGNFVVNFIRPFADTAYIATFGSLSDHYVKTLIKGTSSITFETRTIPAYTLGDGAVIDMKLTGYLI